MMTMMLLFITQAVQHASDLLVTLLAGIPDYCRGRNADADIQKVFA
jgi:hypothetical protein